MIFKKYIICIFSLVLILIKYAAYSQTNLIKSIPIIAVLDFEPRSGVTADTADFVTERVRIELFKSQKFKIVERKDMAKILEEQKLELSGLTGSDYATKVGQLLSAQKIMLGTITRIEGTYYINSRVIDVETGVMEYGDTAKAETQSGLSEASHTIVLEMTGENKDNRNAGKNNGQIEEGTENKGIAYEGRRLSSDITSFVNSTVNYFLDKIHVFNDTDNIKSKETTNDDQYLDNYVDEVKDNRDKFKESKNKKSEISNLKQNEAIISNSNQIPIKEENYMGGMGGPLIKYGLNDFYAADLDLRGNLLCIGGRGIWMINRFFGLGGGGYGGILLNKSNDKYTLSMGYGGPIIDFYYRVDFFRIDLNCLIGAGGYGIVNNNAVSNGNMTNTTDVIQSSGSFFTVEPTILIAFRVTSFLEIGLTTSYLYTSRIKNGNINFENYTFGLSFMFGTGG